MYVRDVMSPNPVTIGWHARIADAMRAMLERKVSGLPVVDHDNRLVGMLTEGDFLRRAETGTQRNRPHWLELLLSPGKLANEYVHSHAGAVADIMSSSVIAVDADATLSDAIALLQRHRIKRLPVLAHGTLVGMLSRADLMRACLSAMPASIGAPANDAAVATRIDERMRSETWCPRANIRVEVDRGVAELLGVVTDERTREGLRVLVENTPGVLNVVDHLTTVEPMSGAIVRTPD